MPTYSRRHHQSPAKRLSHKWKALFLIVLVLVIIAWVSFSLAKTSSQSPPKTTATPKKTQTVPVAQNDCSGNNLSQLIIVSIGEQKMWACDGSKQVYENPVITGMENYPADLTPTGTYHIYAKQTDQHLTGCDSTGCWNDFVYYWMPFLSDQYGIYGFHDATWRVSSAFGNTSIYSNNASHGCVEMPLAAAAWLYNWAQVGTTLTIKS
jgi:lipoprotein-anchoring transpeptidase ErfK/SrfK